MTFEEYIQTTVKYIRENPEQRMGQAYLNVLWIVAPTVYTYACEYADPFNNDSCLPEFLGYVRAQLQ